MAASSLLALIDDIATVLDDVAVMTKVAAKKTAGVLGDDLALNAQQVTGVRADRELPVVWAVAKGSLLNKLILVPLALVISLLAPWAITPMLMVGGAYLCFEGFEKLAHHFLHGGDDGQAHQDKLEALANSEVDMVAYERNKIRGAIRTDFILSAEIIVIALGTVSEAGFMSQFTVVATVAVVMTFGVYGLVAGIVKLDDAGLYLLRSSEEQGAGRWRTWLGMGLLGFAPKLMKTLSVVGTAAMFLVGGGILAHGFGFLHHGIESLTYILSHGNGIGIVLEALVPLLMNMLVGVVAGALVLAVVRMLASILGRLRMKAD